jgi:hypothetical protein
MNSLPTDDQPSTPIQSGPPQGSSVGVAKEVEPVALSQEAGGLQEVGVDVELPREVSASGVRVQPTSVAVPKAVSSLGVKPVGSSKVPQTSGQTMPLTDDQIAKGLTQSIANSWRWLAEWCKKRLKQLRLSS